jgi:cobalt-zinc-cadmium efflux system outer membrane protein
VTRSWVLLIAAPWWAAQPARCEAADADAPAISQVAENQAAAIKLLPPAEYIALRHPEPLPRPDQDATSLGLTLGQVESLALTYNPTLAQAAAQVRAARGEQYQVGLAPNPTLGYVGAEMGNDGQAGQQGFMLGQDFIRGNKLGLNRAVAGLEAQRRQQVLAAQQRRVLTDVRIAVFDADLAQRRFELAGKLQTIGRQAVATAQALIEAEEGRRTDLLQAEIEGQRAAVDLAQATSNVHGAWRRLAAVVGEPSLAPQPLAADVDELRWAASWDETLDGLLRDSPEVAEAQAEVQRARAALARACA